MRRLFRYILTFQCGLLLQVPLQAAELQGTVKLIRKGSAISAENTVVVLEPADPSLAPASTPTEYIITTKNKTFSPQYLVIRSGDSVRFPNQDSIKHNVFSSTDGHDFDLGSYSTGDGPSHRFEGSGIVKIYCNVHHDMASFVRVTRGGWSVITDESGTFAFKDLPAGDYTLHAWNLRGETFTEVQLEDASPSDLDLEIDCSSYRTERHLNKYGKKYPRFSTDDEIY